MTPDIQELKRLAEAARNVAPDVAYVRNQETGDLFEVRVSNFPPADIEVRKMAHGEDVVAEAAYGFSRSADTILALIEAVKRQGEALSHIVSIGEAHGSNYDFERILDMRDIARAALTTHKEQV